MNKENILKEGLLEAYFLGDLSEAEAEQISEIIENDEELLTHYKDIEKSMENLAFENAVTPPSHIKESLLRQVGQSKSKIESDVKKLPNNSLKWFYRIAAGLAILFMTSTFLLWMNLNNVEQELFLSQNEQEKLLDSLNLVTKGLIEKEELISYINNPNTQRNLLVGNTLAPEAMVLSYINHDQQSAIIHIHNLDKLEDKDYQMWADVDGEMIDMGVIDLSKKLLTMNYIKDAESINITIEEKGGSDHPDVSNLIGSVAL